MSEKPLTFSSKVLIAVFITAIFIGFCAFLTFSINILLLIFAGFLVTVFINALCIKIEKFLPVSKNAAFIMILLFLLLIIFGTTFLLGPNIIESTNEFQSQLPVSIEKLEHEIRQYSWGDDVISGIRKEVEAFIANPRIAARVTGIFSSAFSIFLNIFLIVAVGLYGAYDSELYYNNFLKLIPKEHKHSAADTISLVTNSLTRWIVGRLLSMTIIGVFTIIGLWILGIPLAVTLGILAAFLTFIPNFGPLISVIPAALFGFLQSPAKALYVVLLYGGIQLVESYLVTPLIQKKMISLPPALLISFQIIAGVLFGGFGLLLATPALVVVIVLIQTLYVNRYLGKN